MAVHSPRQDGASASELVTVSDWNACYNSGENVIVLSCKVTTQDSSPTISGVGLILNNSKGLTLCTCYVEFSGGTQSASPAINLPTNGLKVGDTVFGVVSGEVNDQHYFFEEQLTIGKC